MKRLSLFKHLALACSLAVVASLTTSCSTVKDPAVRAEQLTAAAPAATVYSYNAAANPNNRSCVEVGNLPDNTARALTMWLRDSTVKPFSYVNPQYYISLPTGTAKAPRVWGICSDGQGNLVGILIPRDGVEAWNLPNLGSYNVYVNDTTQRKALSDAIMEALADHHYDEPRINALKASGLDDKHFLVSKPLTEAELQRLEEERRKKAEAEKAAAEKAAKASSAADSLETTTDDADAETATPVSDAADDDDTTSDDSADDSSDDADDAADDSSSDDAADDDSSSDDED